ncbi:MAG: hypothetical protein ACTSYM_06425 [Candidatus Baldrarchaeia archaeon]
MATTGAYEFIDSVIFFPVFTRVSGLKMVFQCKIERCLQILKILNFISTSKINFGESRVKTHTRWNYRKSLLENYLSNMSSILDLD